MKVSHSGGPFSNICQDKPINDVNSTHKSKSNDRITRYATPNRYDALNTPTSFLDRRPGRSRSSSRCNKDRITYRAHPEINNDDSHSIKPAPINHIPRPSARLNTTYNRNSDKKTQHNGNISTQPHNHASCDPLDMDFLKSRQTPVSLYFESRLNEIKLQRQKERQQENMNAYLLPTHNSQNNHVSLSVYSSMGSVDEEIISNYAPNSKLYQPKLDSSSPYPRNNASPKSGQNDFDSSLSESEVNAFFRSSSNKTPEQRKTPFFPDQRKQSTSYQNAPNVNQEPRNTESSKCRLFIKANDSKPVAKTLVCPRNIANSQDSHLDRHLDHIASKMGLLAASSCDDESLNYENVTDLVVKSGTVQEKQDKELPCHHVASQSNRKNRIGSFLRRLSPRLMRRSKSFSPSRPPRFGNESPASSRAAVTNNPYPSVEPDLSSKSIASQDKPKTGQSVLSKLFKSRASVRSRTSSSGKNSTANSSSPAPWLTSQASPANTSNIVDSICSQKTDSSSRKDSSSISGSSNSWNSNIAPDNRRKLDALDRDRVANPYARFKQNRHQNQQSEQDNPAHLPNSASNDAIGSRDKVSETGPLRPSYFTFDNMTSIQNNSTSGITSPRYVNLSVSAFGYGSYIKPSSSEHSSPDKSESSSAVIAKPPLPALSSLSPCNKLSESSDRQSDLKLHDLAEENNNSFLDSRYSPEEYSNLAVQANNNAAVDLEKTPTRTKTRTVVNNEKFLSSSLNRPKRILNHQSVDIIDSNMSIIRRKKALFKTRSTGEDKDARQRSSLIMLTVAHSSPRGKTHKTISPAASPTSVKDSQITEHANQNQNDSNLINGDAITPVTSPSKVSDPLGVSIMNTSEVVGCEPSPDTHRSSLQNGTNCASSENSQCDQKDGNYFLNLTDTTEALIRKKITTTENDLNIHADTLSDEVSGQIRTTIGKANLLLTEKFEQFRGLCNQNLTSKSDYNDNNEDFPTLSSDLEGFWAMVMLQVDDIDNMFDQIELIRQNNWQPLETPISVPSAPSKSNSKRKSQRTGRPKNPNNANAARKEDPAKIEARKRLIAAKREGLLKKKQELNGNSDNDIIIYS